jgi:hypothetical protein
MIKKDNLFNIHLRLGRSKTFSADLVKLPGSARLRTLIPEHGAYIIELGAPWIKIQMVLKIRPDDRRGSFGTEA